MVQAILFDCFGVLVTDAWLPFKNHHFGDDQAKYDKATDITKQANQGIINHEDFINQIAKLAGVQPAEVAQSISRNVPNEDLFAYISELKKDYKIGLLSNIAADYLSRMFTQDQLALFDGTSLSFKNGWVKPEPQAYELMAKELGVETANCIMVDDQEHNVVGAHDAGMQGIVFETTEQLRAELDKLLAADPKN